MRQFFKSKYLTMLLLLLSVAFTAGCCAGFMHADVEHPSPRWADNPDNVQHLMHSTVNVINPLSGSSSCTGFFIAPDIIMTARHCLDLEAKSSEELKRAHMFFMTQDLYVVPYSEFAKAGTSVTPLSVSIVLMPKEYNAEPYDNIGNDMMLLQLGINETPSKHWLKIADAVPPVGGRVYAAGMPLGQPWIFGEGVVQQYYYDWDDYPRVRILSVGMHVNHGSSGGPLLNNNGEVVGMAHRMAENTYDTAYIPARTLKEFTYGWLDKEK